MSPTRLMASFRRHAFGASRAARTGAVALAFFVARPAHADPESHRAETAGQTTLSVVAQPDSRPLSPDAEALFQRARALHREKKWSEARALYDRAWQIQRSFQVAANLALVELRLGRARDAAEHLSFALSHLPANDPKIDEARTHLEQMLKEATAQVGTLELTVDRQRATIYIDGTLVGSAPLAAPLYVDTGHHVLHVEPDGNAPRVTRELKIQPGVVYQLSLSSTPASEPAVTVSESSPPAALAAMPRDGARADRVSPLTPRVLVLAGEAALTLGAAVLGTVYAFKARSARNNADDLATRINANGDPQRVAQGSMCDPTFAARPLECDELSFQVDSADVYSRVATAALVATGGLALGTVATYFLWPPDAKKRGSGGRVVPGVTASVTDKVQMVSVVGVF